MTGSGGPLPASPPAGFPVYGLDGSRDGVRWLDSFGDRPGDEVRWVRLGQQRPEPGAEIMVETHSRPLTDAQAVRARQPALRSVAFDVAVVLVNVTLPASTVSRPRGLLTALVKHAADRGEHYAEWAPVSWRVDGRWLTAQAWRFAGGWAAFSDAVPGVYLAAAGSGDDPDGLELTALPDGHEYNFALDQPLHPDVIAASYAARARLPRQREEWHADQLGLLEAGSR